MLHSQDYDAIRKNYQKAVSDKIICKEMLKHFENKNNTGLDLAYEGAFQAIWAKHAINPLEKLTTFKKGKKNIEKAVKQNPNLIETRFLRYSIQKESPAFLGYKSNIDEDKMLLNRNIKNVEDIILKQMIINILKS
ncbi:hypothetical protein [Epilithonimonas sp.]|uniref:hypothetical protein n=1 Tax=Epilithonimonas sp. TaxID=2894511 RepID=UPI0028A58525|nr:hypothetical protein [Epilithonimonas sp.]